jgi:aryl-alcohol dehydrogenase-like predicted oxidoreductase
MEIRRLGKSGLRVPALSFGTATFGGGNDFFKAWGTTDAGGAPLASAARHRIERHCRCQE